MADLWDTPLGKARLQELAEQRKESPRASNNRRSPVNMQRDYAGGRSSRLTSGFVAGNTSADAELVSSITTLRARSRALVRDASYAKRAKTVIVNNVIGSGIGMQAQVMTSRDVLNDRINDDIEAVWCEWSEAQNCHTGGRLSFESLERALMGQTFEAGDVFIRIHRRPFGPMGYPFSLELIEAERLADEFYLGAAVSRSGNHLRMGIEVDEFYKPVAYYFRKRHQNEFRFSDQSPDSIERVPAEDIIPLALIDRWPQTRGEPWMHTALLRMQDMDGYSEAEILRARAQAVRMGIIETPEDAKSFGEEQEDGSVETTLEPNTVQKLNPGEKWIDSAPNAPNPQVDPFMRYMLREVAAGVGLSYESISRDYSKSNYSSSRLALIEDRDLWRFYQSWFIRDVRKRIHREWLSMGVLAGKFKTISVESYAIDPKKFEAVLFKPRGWSWIDPSNEVDAYIDAVKNGFTTVTDVIAQTGNGLDLEDVLRVRERELRLMKDKGLVFETSPEVYTADAKKADADAKKAKEPPPDPPDEKSDEDATNAPPKAGRSFLGVVK